MAATSASRALTNPPVWWRGASHADHRRTEAPGGRERHRSHSQEHRLHSHCQQEFQYLSRPVQDPRRARGPCEHIEDTIGAEEPIQIAAVLRACSRTSRAYSMPVTCRLGMGEARSRCGSIARLLKIDDNPYSQTSLGHVSSLERVATGGMWMGMVLASLPGWLSTENYMNFCSHARNYVATVNYVTGRAGRRRYQHFGFFLMQSAISGRAQGFSMASSSRQAIPDPFLDMDIPVPNTFQFPQLDVSPELRESNHYDYPMDEFSLADVDQDSDPDPYIDLVENPTTDVVPEPLVPQPLPHEHWTFTLHDGDTDDFDLDDIEQDELGQDDDVGPRTMPHAGSAPIIDMPDIVHRFPLPPPRVPAAETYDRAHQKWYIRLILLFVLLLHTHHHVSFRACSLILFCMCKIFIALFLIPSDDNMPTTLNTTLARLSIQERFITMAVYPTCHTFTPAVAHPDEACNAQCSICEQGLYPRVRYYAGRNRSPAFLWRSVLIPGRHALGLVKTQWYGIWIKGNSALRASTDKTPRELEEIHKYLAEFEFPPFIGRLNPQVGEPAGGSLSADNYKALATIFGVLTSLISMVTKIPLIWEKFLKPPLHELSKKTNSWHKNLAEWEKKHGDKYRAQQAELKAIATDPLHPSHAKTQKKKKGKRPISNINQDIHIQGVDE
ncbi:hypothetical protein JB92DRAFT_2825442 [Gautieria morchelliformis]|nr:hypothetical protein JB92DRAFT_2825442 [Gautieria morchelliformis]